MSLPVEILIEIACESVQTFRVMLALRPVVRFLRRNRKYVIDKLTKIVDNGSCISYFIGAKLHREGDLPAVEYRDGTKYWYKDGKIHRDGDLPAVIYADGTKVYYQGNKLYRRRGLPAVEYPDNSRYSSYYLNKLNSFYTH